MMDDEKVSALKGIEKQLEALVAVGIMGLMGGSWKFYESAETATEGSKELDRIMKLFDVPFSTRPEEKE